MFPHQNNTPIQHRPEIDGLRAIAVMAVIFFHAGFDFCRGGFIGVDIFFVISGYLIASLMRADLEAGRFNFANFIERRFRRILPALLLVLLVALPLAWVTLPNKDLKQFFESVIAATSFVSNIFFWRESNYFDSASELKPLLHTWSLGVEVQYYLVFPPLILLGWRNGRRGVLSLILVALALSFALTGVLISIDTLAAFYWLPTRIWEFSAGALAAFIPLQRHSTPLKKATQEIFSGIGLLAVLYGIFYFDKRTPTPGVSTLIPVLGAASMMMLSSGQTWTGRILGWKPLSGLGLISYSAYLWHQPMLAFLRHKAPGELDQTIFLGLIGLILLISYLSWRYVEKPFRQTKISTPIFIRSMLGGSILMMSAAMIGYVASWEGNPNEQVALYNGDIWDIDFNAHLADHNAPCTPELAPEKAIQNGSLRCRQSKPGTAANVLLLGDSHAEHLFLGLAEKLPQQNVAYYFKDSPLYFDNPEFSDVFKHIQNEHAIHTVLIASNWGHRIRQIPADKVFADELLKIIRLFISSGKSVYLVDDVPRFPFHAERCKFPSIYNNVYMCSIDKENIIANEKTYIAALDNAKKEIPAIRRIKLRDLFCDPVLCSMVKDGTVLYRDTNHINIPGSRYIAQEIVRQFPELAR